MNLRFCMQDMGGISLLQSLVKLNLLPIVIIEKPFHFHFISTIYLKWFFDNYRFSK